jgi:hypothetical protein
MAKFNRAVGQTLGEVVANAVHASDAALALQEALSAAVEDAVVNGYEATVETNVAFDLDAIVDCSDDGVEYRSIGVDLAEAFGCELSDDGVPDAVVDVLEKLVGQVKARVRKDLEALNLETKNGEIVVKADALTVLDILGSVVDTAVADTKMYLRATERSAIAKHNDEVREANARIIQMPKPAEAAPAPTPAAPAPTPAPAAETAPAPAKKPRKAKAKAKAAEAAPVAPAAPSVKHPVDVAEALAVLSDDNATPEAIEAALALLA